MFFTIVLVIVDTHKDREIDHIFCISREQHFLGSGNEVLCGQISRIEDTSTFCNDINLKIFPGKILRITFSEERIANTIDDEIIPSYLDLAGERTKDRIVLQKIGHRVHISDVIDRYDLDLARCMCNTEDGSANSPKTIDSYSIDHRTGTSFLHSTNEKYLNIVVEIVSNIGRRHFYIPFFDL